MKALITGASSGIGRDMAKYLGKKGFDLILVARNKEKLEKVKSEIKTKVEIIAMDLASEENCKNLYNQAKDIDILINNAGFRNIWRIYKNKPRNRTRNDKNKHNCTSHINKTIFTRYGKKR